MDLHQYFTADVSVDEEELTKVWKSSTFGSGCRIFLSNYSTLRNWAFSHNLAHISGQTDRIFMNILSWMYPCTRKSR